MQVEGAAADLLWRHHHLTAVAHQQADGGLVHLAEDVGHHAAGEKGYPELGRVIRGAADDASGKEGAGRDAGHQLLQISPGAGQKVQERGAPQQALEAGTLVQTQGSHQVANALRAGEEESQDEATGQPGCGGVAAVAQDFGPGFFHDLAVADAGRAGGLAVAALQAEVEVADNVLAEGDTPLAHRSHEVEPAPGRLGLQAELDVGGAVGKAEAAANAVHDILKAGGIRAAEALLGSRRLPRPCPAHSLPRKRPGLRMP